MNRTIPKCLGILCGLAFLAATSLGAAETKRYQVTGPVLEVTSTYITVQKDDEKWQIARDSSTKVPADVKVGDKVTVHYYMVATDVQLKDGASKEGKAKGKKAQKTVLNTARR